MAKDWQFLNCFGGEKVKVDTEDFDRLSKMTWRVTKTPSGRNRVVTSVRTAKGPRSITLGNYLMKPPKGKQVYPRRFFEGLDYRKNNLIVCTAAERQQMLPKKQKGATSKYRGVSYSKSNKRWRAAIAVNSKSINLGNFKSEEDAAEAYNQAARKHFGDNAYQNNLGRKKVDRD